MVYDNNQRWSILIPFTGTITGTTTGAIMKTVRVIGYLQKVTPAGEALTAITGSSIGGVGGVEA